MAKRCTNNKESASVKREREERQTEKAQTAGREAKTKRQPKEGGCCDASSTSSQQKSQATSAAAKVITSIDVGSFTLDISTILTMASIEVFMFVSF